MAEFPTLQLRGSRTEIDVTY